MTQPMFKFSVDYSDQPTIESHSLTYCVSADVDLPTLLEHMTAFLRGAGYHLKGELIIDE